MFMFAPCDLRAAWRSASTTQASILFVWISRSWYNSGEEGGEIMYYFLLIVGSIISLIIIFYLIKVAVKSALRDILGEYSTPGEILKELKTVTGILNPPETTEQKKEVVLAEEMNMPIPEPGEAYYTVASDTGLWLCSQCGYKQKGPRAFCFYCRCTFKEKLPGTTQIEI